MIVPRHSDQQVSDPDEVRSLGVVFVQKLDPKSDSVGILVLRIDVERFDTAQRHPNPTGESPFRVRPLR